MVAFLGTASGILGSSSVGDVEATEAAEEERGPFSLSASAASIPRFLEREQQLIAEILDLRQDQGELESTLTSYRGKEVEFVAHIEQHMEDVQRTEAVLLQRVEALDLENRKLQDLSRQQADEQLRLRSKLEGVTACCIETEQRTQTLMDRLVSLLSPDASIDSIQREFAEELIQSEGNIDEQLARSRVQLKNERQENLENAMNLMDEQKKTKRLHDEFCATQRKFFSPTLSTRILESQADESDEEYQSHTSSTSSMRVAAPTTSQPPLAAAGHGDSSREREEDCNRPPYETVESLDSNGKLFARTNKHTNCIADSLGVVDEESDVHRLPTILSADHLTTVPSMDNLSVDECESHAQGVPVPASASTERLGAVDEDHKSLNHLGMKDSSTAEPCVTDSRAVESDALQPAPNPMNLQGKGDAGAARSAPSNAGLVSKPPPRGRPWQSPSPTPQPRDRTPLMEQGLRNALDAAAFNSPVVRVCSGIYQFGPNVHAYVRLQADDKVYASEDGRDYQLIDAFIASISERAASAPEAPLAEATAAAFPRPASRPLARPCEPQLCMARATSRDRGAAEADVAEADRMSWRRGVAEAGVGAEADRLGQPVRRPISPRPAPVAGAVAAVADQVTTRRVLTQQPRIPRPAKGPPYDRNTMSSSSSGPSTRAPSPDDRVLSSTGSITPGGPNVLSTGSISPPLGPSIPNVLELIQRAGAESKSSVERASPACALRIDSPAPARGIVAGAPLRAPGVTRAPVQMLSQRSLGPQTTYTSGSTYVLPRRALSPGVNSSTNPPSAPGPLLTPPCAQPTSSSLAGPPPHQQGGRSGAGTASPSTVRQSPSGSRGGPLGGPPSSPRSLTRPLPHVLGGPPPMAAVGAAGTMTFLPAGAGAGRGNSPRPRLPTAAAAARA